MDELDCECFEDGKKCKEEEEEENGGDDDDERSLLSHSPAFTQ